jgi:hypothetical protein
MTKVEATQNFSTNVLGRVAQNDAPALCEAWNNFTDALCKAGKITDHQYSTWTHPRITKRAHELAAERYATEFGEQPSCNVWQAFLAEGYRF